MYCNKQATKAEIEAGRDAKCEKCGRWGHPFDMDYDDDTGFICELARDECDKIMNKITKKKIKLIKPKEEEEEESVNDEEKQCADCEIEAKKHCDECGGYGSCSDDDEEEVAKCPDSYSKHNKCPLEMCYDCDESREEEETIN